MHQLVIKHFCLSLFKLILSYVCHIFINKLNTLIHSNLAYNVLFHTGIAYSVHLLATSWTVRGSNSDSGEIFRACPDPPWGPSSLLYDRYRGVKRPRRSVNHQPPCSARVKERVKLNLCSPLGFFGLWKVELYLPIPSYPFLYFSFLTNLEVALIIKSKCPAPKIWNIPFANCFCDSNLHEF